MKIQQKRIFQLLNLGSILAWISLGVVLLLSLNIFTGILPLYRLTSFSLILAAFSLVCTRLLKYKWVAFASAGIIFLINTSALLIWQVPFTEIPLIILSVILMLLSKKERNYDDLAHVIALPVAFMLYIVPIRLLLGIEAPYRVFNTISEINGGLGVFFVLIAILLFYPRTWVTRPYSSHYTGSRIARNLLGSFIILPILIGWFRLLGERTGTISSEFGVAVVVVAYTFGLLSIVWLIIQPFNKREKLLNQSREQYRMLAEMSPYAVFLNRDNKIAYVNPAAVKMFRAKNAHQLIGKDAISLFAPAFHEHILERIQLLKEGHQVPIAEIKISCVDGTERDVESIGSSFVDEKGQAIQVILRDITEARKAQVIASRYELISKYARDPLLMISKHGDIIEVNDAALEFYGYSREEMTMLQIFDLRESEREDTLSQMSDAFKHGILFESVHKRKDGTLVPVEVSSRGVNLNGTEMLLSVIRDISERKKRENELIRLNQTLIALEKCSQAMVRVNNEKEFLNEICQIIIGDCNYSMVWIGYAMDDVNKTVLPMAHSGFDKGYLESLRITWADDERGNGPTGTAIRTGRPYICKNILTDPAFLPWRSEAQKRGYASSIALPLISGEAKLGSLGIYSREPDGFSPKEVELLAELANDVSYGITAIRWKIAREKAEQKLKESAESLMELNATKDKFFGILAHDLKNPFVSILGASELLVSQDDVEPEIRTKLLKILHQAARNGYSILENLLEWSRSQTGRLQMNPDRLNLYEIISQNLENASTLAAGKNILLNMEVAPDIEVYADANMIHTVMRNLLSNAIKFSYCDSNVMVKVETGDAEVLVSVIDHGMGIPEEEQKNLFRIDVQYLRHGTSDEKGTGLGLILCREFIEKHGGNIGVESKEETGSTFYFTLPLFKS